MTPATVAEAGPTPAGWRTAEGRGVRVAWAPAGPLAGHVSLGAQRVPLARFFGGPNAEADRWRVRAQRKVLGGRALVWLTLTGEWGEDLRTEASRVAVLPDPPTTLTPLWVGDGTRTTTELDACTVEVRAAFQVEGDTLVVKRVGEADWQEPAEDENSQTPSFTALKATCKAPAPTEARVKLPAR